MKNINRDFLVIAAFIIVPIIMGIINYGSSKSKGNALSFGNFGKSIGIVNLKGVIYSSSKIVKEIEAYQENRNILGIIVRIDSPGGAVAPSQEIYQALIRFRESKKPIVISMGTVAASGGYYAASAGDIIFANSGTLTGSIGVIMQFPYYYEFLKKWGIGMHTITAGKLKDAGSPYRPLSKNDEKYFNHLIANTHKQFIRDVAAGRGKDTADIKPLAEGEIFTGDLAKKNGLIDTIGTYRDAKDYILDITGLPKNTEFTETTKKTSFLGTITENRVTSIFKRFTAKGGVYFLSQPLM